MLQYLPQPDDKYSVAEQCQMVIEGGCAWIQLHVPGMSDSDIRDLANELIPLCRETSTILMIEDRPELAKELGLHGVHITLNSGINARQVREDFGPEAIIGLDVDSAASILALKGADIDYVTLPHSTDLNRCKDIIADAVAGGSELPVVLSGQFGKDDCEKIMQSGAQGVCTGRSILSAADPVSYTEEFINALNKARN